MRNRDKEEEHEKSVTFMTSRNSREIRNSGNVEMVEIVKINKNSILASRRLASTSFITNYQMMSNVV